MKAIRFLLLVFSCGSSLMVVAQQKTNALNGLRFYEELAARDAEYEQSFILLSNQDESDYWNDQKNFERNLGKMDFTSYLIYMKGKKDSYTEHLQNCQHKRPHSELYFQKAKAYLSLSDSEYQQGISTGRITQSSVKKN